MEFFASNSGYSKPDPVSGKYKNAYRKERFDPEATIELPALKLDELGGQMRIANEKISRQLNRLRHAESRMNEALDYLIELGKVEAHSVVGRALIDAAVTKILLLLSARRDVSPPKRERGL